MSFDDIKIGMLLLWRNDDDIGIVMAIKPDSEHIQIQWRDDGLGWYKCCEYTMELLS